MCYSKTNIEVSVVMPVYNEEKYIGNCIKSLLNQDYPIDNMEWIFVDGCSKDKTKKIIGEYIAKYPKLVHLIDNPNKTVPFAMNLGIRKSIGRYIVRLDAHAEYSSDYISKCIYYLEKTGADNVGGVLETKSNGFVGNSVAMMISSKFGVGNSEFRTNGKSGYVDTVPFGAFRREVFEKYGYYDERLTRNQDNEMNYRIRKNGGKIYLAEDINLSYYCRDSIKGIADMAIKNGKWNIKTMRLCPGSMGIRHFIPFIFLLSIIAFMILICFIPQIGIVFASEMILYLLLDVYFSFSAAENYKHVPLLIVLFPVFHITYGFGSLLGIFTKV